MGWGYYYTPRQPKKVKGGIKAQSKRGNFGQSWWAKRWNQTLEEYGIGERLKRGMTYARKGQVASIKIQKGLISATVQGSWEYKVEIEIKTLKTLQWSIIAKSIFAQPAIAAELLAGQMPSDIEDVFKNLRIRLFPSHKDIDTDCTCPDWSNPCKHIAAVYLLLAEEFDRDPFLIFQLRGIERKELLKMAGMDKEKKRKEQIAKNKETVAKKSTKNSTIAAAIKTKTHKTKKKTPKQRLIEPKKFWGNLDDQIFEYSDGNDNTGNAIIPDIPAVLIKQIGNFPFWRGEENFMEIMEKVYADASNTGVNAFLGDEYKNKFLVSADEK